MSLASTHPDAVLPPLCRGEPFTLRIETRPATDFTGRTVEVHLDASDGTRTTLTELVGTGTGTYEGNGVTHSDDETYVIVNYEDTQDLTDGDTYQVSVVVDGDHWGLYFMEVFTPAGGIV